MESIVSAGKNWRFGVGWLVSTLQVSTIGLTPTIAYATSRHGRVG